MLKKHPFFTTRHFTSGLAASIAGLGLAAFPASLQASDVYWNATSTNWDTSTATWNTAADNSGTTQAWVNGDNAIFSTTTVTGAGPTTLTNGGVTVDNITLASGTPRRILVSGGTLTLADTSMTIDVQQRISGDYDLRINSIIADSSGGASSIIKNGVGILHLGSQVNTFSGGVTLNQGTLAFENAGSLGTGTVTLAGGNFVRNFASFTTPNALNVTGSVNVVAIQQNSNWTLSGAITGSGTFNVSNVLTGFTPSNMTIFVTGDTSAYTGTFSQNTLASGGNRLRFGSAAGSSTIAASNAKFFTTGSTTGGNCLDRADGAYGTFQMGELAGTGGRVRAGWGTSSTTVAGGTTTFEIGNLNTDSKFAGIIQDNLGSGTLNATNGQAAVTKVGTGTLQLDLATGNGYSGGTAVNVGRLLVSNTSGSGTGTGAVTVASGATLGGTGIITPSGANGISVSGTLAPGGSVSATTGGSFSNSVGTLTFNLGSSTGVVTMASGATFSFDLNSSLAADKISITTATAGDFVFNNNTINLTDLSGGSLTAGAYTLFSSDAASTYAGVTVDGSNFITSGLSVAAFSGYNTTLQISGNDIVLNLTAVPEPRAFALAIAGLLGVLVLIRRRNQQI